MQTSFHHISLLILLLFIPLSSIGNTSPEKPPSTEIIAPESLQTTDKTLFKATYKGKISGFKVEMIRTLVQQPNGEYIFSSKAQNFFASIDEVSTFIVKNNAVEINNYTYTRSIAKRVSLETIDYDWNSMQAEYNREKQPKNLYKHKLVANILDPSLYQLFLQADSFLNKPSLSYSFIKRRRIENYRFQRLSDEKLTLVDKEYKTVVLMRANIKQTKKTKIWLIPELDYQIAKIEHTDNNGSTYQAYLSEYSSDQAALHDFYKKMLPIDNIKSTK